MCSELHDKSLNPYIDNNEIYNQWAKNYDKYVDSLEYNGPRNIVSFFKEKFETKNNFKILDFGCGTGKVGEELRKQLNNKDFYLEGIDISAKMIDIAISKKVYNKNTLVDLTKTIYNEKYDYILSSGVFLEGHVSIKNINRLFDLLKKNGLLIFTIRTSFKDNNYIDFKKYVLENKKFNDVYITDIEYLKNVSCNLVCLTK
jgi:predicted TPR repeat methyltransferase